ncbi:hypothetical protein DXG03_009412 [Asterophora parasitica]|uniref:DNA polymerase delta subunit 3 n=1 Tax=Asterophora parasitica TaxID=117018 RepID=A0A9P7GBD5_9AGAR|nr:hypothetical protein DXG03_009412 [Asterophora parasitica]
MSSQSTIDFLTKQIFIEKSIVTYRSLSRELRIHVNTAKNELATYHENAPYHSQTSCATYLLSGEGIPAGDSDVDMDYDLGADVNGDHEDDGEDIPQMKMLLVNERDLDVHVRTADRGKQGKEMVKAVGKIVGTNIQQIVHPTEKGAKPTRQPVAGPSRQKPVTDTTAPAKKEKEKAAVTEPTKEMPKAIPDKPKGSGKLDFTKAKPKEKKPEAPVEKSKEKAKAFFSTPPADVKGKKAEETKATLEPPKGKKAKQTLELPKRGTKRKSVLAMSDSEDDSKCASSAAASRPASQPPSPQAKKEKENVRVQKRTVISDSEDEPPKPARKARTSRAAKAVDSDTEDARALMDIDDDEVERVTRETPSVRDKTKKRSAEIEEDSEAEYGQEDKSSAAKEDIDMASDSEAKPKPKKRKEKKVVPIGSNGLKKRRVVKSRSVIDGKGYMVTEDYSEYESVDEEDEEPEPVKGKAKAIAPVNKAKVKQADEEGLPAPTPKIKPAAKSAPAAKAAKSGSKAGAAKGAPKQKSLANFFTSKPKN